MSNSDFNNEKNMENKSLSDEIINIIKDYGFDKKIFSNSFKYISENYRPVQQNLQKSNHEKTEFEVQFYSFFRSHFPKFLSEWSNNFHDFKVVPSANPNLMIIAYLGLSHEKNDDFYIYYLFKYDFSAFYVTLGIKAGDRSPTDLNEEKLKFKNSILHYYRKYSNNLNFDIMNFDDSVDLEVEKLKKIETDEEELKRLKNQSERASQYENATVFAKKYDLNDLDDNTVLENDLSDFLKLYNFIKDNKIYENMDDDIFVEEFIDSDCPRNIIYFGAPGTGKSFTLNKQKDKLLCSEFKDNYERVTFHPDYSYANFVGTYKPVSVKDDIKYDYVAGPFMRLLVKAFKRPSEPFLLIIEEINRSNVSAVFGDVFQLLDRKDNVSRYDINVSEEMGCYLLKELKHYMHEKYLIDLLGENFDKLKIPKNMFIWATMNSADQGVFPMDTAFKRRWDFKYLGINHGEEKIENTYFVLYGKKISWNKLRKKINDRLLSNGFKINEDKLLGPFFAFNEFLNKRIPDDVFKETFQNKIIMYLFEDAARARRNELFDGVSGDKTNITYSDICNEFQKEDVGLGIFKFINISDISMDEEDE